MSESVLDHRMDLRLHWIHTDHPLRHGVMELGFSGKPHHFSMEPTQDVIFSSRSLTGWIWRLSHVAAQIAS